MSRRRSVKATKSFDDLERLMRPPPSYGGGGGGHDSDSGEAPPPVTEATLDAGPPPPFPRRRNSHHPMTHPNTTATATNSTVAAPRRRNSHHPHMSEPRHRSDTVTAIPDHHHHHPQNDSSVPLSSSSSSILPPRRQSVSKPSDDTTNSRMKDALQAVTDYRTDWYHHHHDNNDNGTGGEMRMEDLKDHLAPSAHKNLVPKQPRRRSSLSSSGSHGSNSNKNTSTPNMSYTASNYMGTTLPNKSATSFALSVDSQQQQYQQQYQYHQSLTEAELPSLDQHNKSSQTLPVGNVGRTEREKKRKHQIKKDQLIESIVWFSFHIPRTVLYDLIAHELEVWRRNSRRGSKSRRQSDGGGARRDGSGAVRRKDSMRSTSAASAATSTKASDDDDDDDDDDDGSVSSLSDEGGRPPQDSANNINASHSGKLIREEQHGGHNSNTNYMIRLPKAVERESAILFVDMSGFTKLSTLLDVESLSKVINSYFDMIVSEVILFGGDILKFAGDAFFAEWRVIEELDSELGEGDDDVHNPLSDLNASLVSINEMVWDDIDVPQLSNCVLMAAKCATSIVKKFSDYHVTTADNRKTNEAMLNVHCGIGVGHMVGLHVRDYKEGQEEEAVELRREFLILGDPIDQVSKAADVAKDGEVLASPEALLSLAFCCELSDDQRLTNVPLCIASRDESYLNYDSVEHMSATGSPTQLYESLRVHCAVLQNSALQRLNLQMALYVHPVIRADELALSTAIQAGKISQPTETLESRHRAEAELRSVYTMFITPIISPKISGRKAANDELYNMLADIMWVTSRELDRYSGHLRQFIVDDKGVVLIATFGLRGSTFPNMVENNCLPATFAIHRALKNELKVDSRIGATFGKVYCGVVGGVRRHEFACMGAPVNLAARLMGSKVNNGILVDEAVQEQCRGRYTFKTLPPVKAKGYDKPVPILEPIADTGQGAKKKKSAVSFIGRKGERRAILSIAHGILEEPEASQSSMIFLTGESGIGKSALALSIMDEMKKKSVDENNVIITARSTSTETEQKVPLSSYRKVLMSVIRDRCDYSRDEPSRVAQTSVSGVTSEETSSKLTRALTRRTRMLTSQAAGDRGKSLLVKLTNDVGSSRSNRSRNGGSLTHSRNGALNQSLHGALNQSLHGALNQSPYGALNQSPNGALNQSQHGGKNSTKSLRPRLVDPLSQSLHRAAAPVDLARAANINSLHLSPVKTQSLRMYLPKITSTRHGLSRYNDDSSSTSADNSVHRQSSTVPYFEQLCWACEELDYPYEYADIVGSQFLGFESATPITHINGHVPSMEELVDFLALAFIKILDFADLTTILLDDFQWLDSFSWRIFRVICSRAGRTLLICATRSHDKQALRRIMSATTPDNRIQSQMIEISLGPLDFDDIRDLMSNFMVHKKSAISDSLCSDIFQRTGGLPVYVIQLLENIKRKRTLELVDGELQWTAEGLKQKKNLGSTASRAVMEETFLSRFDALDVRVRKVLQSCAVWGLSFQLSDVMQVHPEMEESDIEASLESAIEEMILFEQISDDDMSVQSGSTSASEGKCRSAASETDKGGERFFQFSHAMWQKNVLATMLKERKIELHRLIAESMERGKIRLEEIDISRLLTLFDHWKACGDFSKVAPLALAVGARLEEWDLSSQSLELYEDALEIVFDGVETTDQVATVSKDWVKVKGRMAVLDMVLRLYICIGLCHQRLGKEDQSILFFEDAYNIIATASKHSVISRSLAVPIVSSLCVLKLEEEFPGPEETIPLETLVENFVTRAKLDGKPVHIGRSLTMKATYEARVGLLKEALETVTTLDNSYDIEKNSSEMIAEYGRDYAIECMALSSQWMYLQGMFDEAEKRARRVMNHFLGLLDPADIDYMMQVVVPIIQVMSLLEHAKTADWVLKKYVINPYHDFQVVSDFWEPLFNPLAYLLELTMMDESNERDDTVLEDLEEWVLDEKNGIYDAELERKAHLVLGELCWRLLKFKSSDDTNRAALMDKARSFLSPVAHYERHDLFLKSAAQALLDALD